MSVKNVVVFCANGFEEVEAITIIDYLRRVGLQVKLLGIGACEICGAHDIKILADETLTSINTNVLPDAVIIPGGMPGSLNISKNILAKELVLAMHAHGKLIGALCAAPVVVLGAWGLLKGKKYTCFTGMEKELETWCGSSWKELTHGSTWISDRVVKDDTIITSRAAGTAEEFVFELIRYIEGEEKALALANKIIAR